LQYIENSLLALRVVHYTLARVVGGPMIRLFPMIHIGSAAFYAEVQSSLERCDVVVYEGVRTFRTRLLTLAYRWVARRKRLGLISQGEGIRLKTLTGRLVHGDVSTGEFGASWGRLPLYARMALLAGAPIYGVLLYLTASRESIGRGLSREDTSSREEAAAEDASLGVRKVLVDGRDAKLISVLERILDSAGQEKCVGILYGAAHMVAVTDWLIGKQGYRVTRGEWVEVFAYEEK
jgi:hypothetical protein